jgi:hypothetical protein
MKGILMADSDQINLFPDGAWGQANERKRVDRNILEKLT